MSMNIDNKMSTNLANEEWIDQPEEGDEIQISEYDITSAPNDFNVLTISNFIDLGSIILPMFQRNFVWDLKRASKLIESLILGLPVPQTFLYEDKKNEFLILDGQQRLMSVYFFIKKRFPKVNKRAALRKVFMDNGRIPEKYLYDDEYFEPFNLKLPKKTDGSSSIFEGLNYETLDTYQRRFQLRPIRNVIVKQNEPKNDNSSIYEIFDRLNTGGIILKSQEIRANLYYSEFYKTIYALNGNRTWRHFLQKDDEDIHMRDVELLLRAFAMLVDWNNYRPSMVRFLNEFSHKAKKEFDAGFVEKLKIIFQDFMDSISDLPANTFFSKTSNRFSISLFDAIFVAQCSPRLENFDFQLPQINKQTIDNISSSKQFVRMLQEGTTKQSHVKGRIDIAREELANIGQ